LLASVAALTALSYWRTRHDQDPGLTTEFALLLTVLAGALAMQSPAGRRAVAIVTALLLEGRERLHTSWARSCTEEEVRSALILAAAVVVVMPLLPDQKMGPYDALNPRSVWRWWCWCLRSAPPAMWRLGCWPALGLPISGLASGFVSSSATIGAMGRASPRRPP
jgi:uncharacterized membrane protein (DUF4010 family)